jgi:transcriptional regulator with XRE-family HTH domain
MPVLGERFRAAREARGLTLSEVAEEIRIRSVYLSAIEEENWSAIGAPVYTRGFLRTYARFLGIEPEEAVAAFNTATGTLPATAAPPALDDVRTRRASGRGGGLSPLIWVASIVAIALVAFVVYNALTLHPQRPEPIAAASQSASPAAASPTPNAFPSPQATGSLAPGEVLAMGPNTISVRLSAPSWLRVSVDGSVSIEGTFPTGTARTFHGKSAFVRIGNAGGVEIFVDGKSIGTLGKSGAVVERNFTL